MKKHHNKSYTEIPAQILDRVLNGEESQHSVVVDQQSANPVTTQSFSVNLCLRIASGNDAMNILLISITLCMNIAENS